MLDNVAHTLLRSVAEVGERGGGGREEGTGGGEEEG